MARFWKREPGRDAQESRNMLCSSWSSAVRLVTVALGES